MKYGTYTGDPSCCICSSTPLNCAGCLPKGHSSCTSICKAISTTDNFYNYGTCENSTSTDSAQCCKCSNITQPLYLKS